MPLSRKYSPSAVAANGARYRSGAGSEAEAATTIVYAIAPRSVSICTTCEIDDRFWPTAQ